MQACTVLIASQCIISEGPRKATEGWGVNGSLIQFSFVLGRCPKFDPEGYTETKNTLKGTHTNRWLDVLNEIQETRQKKLEAKRGRTIKELTRS